MSEGVRQGDALSKYLTIDSKLSRRYFGNDRRRRKTGKLDESLLFLANFYESELDESTQNMSNILEPAMLLFMVDRDSGGFGHHHPIYSMTQNIHG